jgi:hypothetical protein
MLSISQPAFFHLGRKIGPARARSSSIGGGGAQPPICPGRSPATNFPARFHVTNSSREIPRYRFVLRGVPLETDFSHDQFVLRAKKYCYRIHNGFETDSYWIHHGFITGSHIGFIFIMDSQWIHKSAKAFIHSFVGTTAFILRVDGY